MIIPKRDISFMVIPASHSIKSRPREREGNAESHPERQPDIEENPKNEQDEKKTQKTALGQGPESLLNLIRIPDEGTEGYQIAVGLFSLPDFGVDNFGDFQNVFRICIHYLKPDGRFSVCLGGIRRLSAIPL